MRGILHSSQTCIATIGPKQYIKAGGFVLVNMEYSEIRRPIAALRQTVFRSFLSKVPPNYIMRVF
jgi:hypothetical protein